MGVVRRHESSGRIVAPFAFSDLDATPWLALISPYKRLAFGTEILYLKSPEILLMVWFLAQLAEASASASPTDVPPGQTEPELGHMVLRAIITGTILVLLVVRTLNPR